MLEVCRSQLEYTSCNPQINIKADPADQPAPPEAKTYDTRVYKIADDKTMEFTQPSELDFQFRPRRKFSLLFHVLGLAFLRPTPIKNLLYFIKRGLVIVAKVR